MHVVPKPFDFFFKSEFSLFQVGEKKVIWVRTVQFVLNELVQLMVLIRKFLDMRLQAHVR